MKEIINIWTPDPPEGYGVTDQCDDDIINEQTQEDMIYIETITGNLDTFRIERQKNTPNGEWYGIGLYKNNSLDFMADNDTFIHDLQVTLIDAPKKMMEEMGVKYTEENVKLILKVVKKADKLGWFDHLK